MAKYGTKSNRPLLEAAREGYGLGSGLVRGMRAQDFSAEEAKKGRAHTLDVTRSKAAADLSRTLAGERYKADLTEEAELRRGQQELQAINDVLSRNPELAVQMGLGRTETPVMTPSVGDEAIPAPHQLTPAMRESRGLGVPAQPTQTGGTPQAVFDPFQAEGRGAGALAKLISENMRAMLARERDATSLERIAQITSSRENIAGQQIQSRERVAAENRAARQQELIMVSQRMFEIQWRMQDFTQRVLEPGKDRRAGILAGGAAKAGTAEAAAREVRQYLDELRRLETMIAAQQANPEIMNDPVMRGAVSANQAAAARLRDAAERMMSTFEVRTEPDVQARPKPAQAPAAPKPTHRYDPNTGRIVPIK